jgi:hypothetical protein
MQTNSHIACPICYKQCRGRLIKHLVEHGYNDEKSFLLDYPDSPLETGAWKLAKKKMSEKAKLRMLDPKEREKISIATKKGMAVPEVRERFRKIVCKPLSDETKKKMSISISKALSNPTVKEKMYTDARNKKISDKKKIYWNENPDAKIRVGQIWKAARDKNPEEWKKRLLSISRKGFEAAWGKKETSLEEKYYNMLKTENIEYIPQYELSGKIYDAYLPSYNTLLEFDGVFWHPISLKECQYEWQIGNYHNDRQKDEIAKSNNMRLIRIREDVPVDSIKSLLSNIYNK